MTKYTLLLLLNDQDRDRLFAIRERTGQPVSDQIRRAIRHWLDAIERTDPSDVDDDAVRIVSEQSGRLEPGRSLSASGKAGAVRRRVGTAAAAIHGRSRASAAVVSSRKAGSRA